MQRDKEARYSMFSMNKFHYLNVPRVGMLFVNNDFEYAFKCLQQSHVSLWTLLLKGNYGASYCHLISTATPRNSNKTKVGITVTFW